VAPRPEVVEAPKPEPPRPPADPPKPIADPVKPPPEETPKPAPAPVEALKPEPPKPDPAPAPPPPPPARPLPAPDPARLKEAEKAFQKTFEAEYARRLPSDRLALAKKLLALDPPADPAQDFVRLRDARDLAAQGGDAAAVVAAAEKVAGTFALDALGFRSEGLLAVANVKTTEGAAAHARACLAAIEEAVALDRYDVTSKLASKADAAAKSAKDDELAASIKAANKDAAAFASEFQQLRAYAETLEKRPDDAASNLNLGKFRAFTKGDWARGLPLLLKGSDPVLRSLAEKEIAKPEDPATRVDLCEGWLAQSDKEKTNALRKENLLEVARHWFTQVEGQLTEADRTRLGKRLGPAPTATAPRKPAPATPTVRPGPQPGTFDLLSLVDPGRDTVHGAWTRQGTALLSPAAGDNMNTGSARIWIPYAPPEEYELFIEVERRSGTEDLVVGLVSPDGTPIAFGLDGWGTQGGCGVFMGGRWNRVAPQRVLGPTGRFTIGIHVRRQFRVRVQNQDVISIPNYDGMSMPPHVQIPGRTGGIVIGGVRSSFLVHSVVLKPIVGQGRAIAR
jgi:hypothetical protein